MRISTGDMVTAEDRGKSFDWSIQEIYVVREGSDLVTRLRLYRVSGSTVSGYAHLDVKLQDVLRVGKPSTHWETV